MKPISETNALEKLFALKANFKSEIAHKFEHRAKSCLTCETPGACCLDAHFVNVHISRLEAVAIRRELEKLPIPKQNDILARIDETVDKYDLTTDGDTFKKTYACPLFEKAIGCLVHNAGKPVPCVAHACYENTADLPPDTLAAEQEERIDTLNRRTYGRAHTWLLLPLAIQKNR